MSRMFKIRLKKTEWYVRLPDAQHSGLVRVGIRHRKTGPELLQNPSVKDGDTDLYSISLCIGPGKAKRIPYTSERGVNSYIVFSHCCVVANIQCQSRGSIALLQMLFSELLVYPPAVQHLTVTTGGGRHGQSMKLWEKNCSCVHHLYTVELNVDSLN